MSDLFHIEVPDEYIVRVPNVMVQAKWHTYQVLTKRSMRLQELLNGRLRFAAEAKHIWWGVSVEDVRYGKPRITDLQSSAAKVKFLSIEPLLEDLGDLNLSGISWVIVGGESGPGARPMEEQWVLNVLNACRSQDVKFFFKQWGGVHKKKNGRKLKGRIYDEFPAAANHPMPNRSQRELLANCLEQQFLIQNEERA
jgi:protein gp37